MRDRRRAAGLVVLALALGSMPGAGSASSGASAPPWVPGEALVRFAAGARSETRAAALDRIDGRIIRSYPAIGFHRVAFDGAVERALDILRDADAVALAEPNVIGEIALDANDPCIGGCEGGSQWNLAAVNAFAGWELVPARFYTASEKKQIEPVKVAVLDTKIDVNQGDWINAEPLPKNGPWDAANGGQLAMADALDVVPPARQGGTATFHGTFTAGILGASANNGSGMAGLGYRAQLVPITVIDGDGIATAADVAEGILHARAIGARVINLSFGLRQSSTAVQDAIDLATHAGALVVAAAGNEGSDAPFYPSWHRNVMTVSAVDTADRPAFCSNHNPHVSVAAPGMGILSMDIRVGSGYSSAGCGTSTAAPHVSALAALLFAQDPARTPAEVRERIERTADDDRFRAGRDDFAGHGRVNFQRALWIGDEPLVDRVIATVPRATGGSTSVSASATAASTRPITGAEYFIDRLGPEGTGGAVSTVDGSFDGTVEGLTTEIAVPLSFPSGVHRLFMRARDDLGWGPASVGVLVVDRHAPVIERFEASQVAISSLGQAVELAFEARDDFSMQLTATFQVWSEVTGEVVFTSEPSTMSRFGSAVWEPAPGLIGPYRIELTLTDEGGNPARARARTVVV